MASYPEPLEQAFQRVEAESERRAQLEEEEWTEGQLSTSERPSVVPRERRRGSVSISKLGELAPGGLSELSYSGPPTPRLSMIPTSKADFYQSQLSRSMDSFSSAHLGEDAKTEEDHGVTQVEYVTPQTTSISKAVGNLLPRRLSRARSATVVSALQESNVVIGVSVEEATAEAQDGQPQTAGAVAYGPGGRKLGPLDSSLPGRWVGRAKSLTKKFRRRSAGPLNKDPS